MSPGPTVKIFVGETSSDTTPTLRASERGEVGCCVQVLGFFLPVNVLKGLAHLECKHPDVFLSFE